MPFKAQALVQVEVKLPEVVVVAVRLVVEEGAVRAESVKSAEAAEVARPREFTQ